MRFTVTTPPAEEPITLDEAKEHLRMLDDDDDPYIEGLIVAARSHVEEYTSRALVAQTITFKLDGFHCKRIELPRPPLVSVTSIQYVDDNGNTQTLSTDDYLVSASGEPGFVEPAYGTTWPSARDQADAVTITYVAGYGDAGDVPSIAKHAMKLLIGHWFRNRSTVNIGNIVNEIPFAAKSLLSMLGWGR